MSEKKMTIGLEDNGPLAVSGSVAIKKPDGDVVEATDTVYLCRCGGSSNKPFCDGTHSRNGFSGERVLQSALDGDKAYEGKTITIHDNRAICSHATRCVSEFGSVFKANERPWIVPDGAAPEEIKQAVRRCPSGALSYTVGGKRSAPSPENAMIDVEKGGPYYCAGAIELESVLQPPNPRQFALCRCGASRNKPFCDGCHHEVDFD